jgi:hypothetical protein
VLNALKRKTSAEVAHHLVRIFSTFGAPKILQSDNGREFANKVIIELVSKWPSCRIVHGKPRHSQSQGSVERANRDIGDILTIWLRDNKTTKWADALPFVQAAKNRRFHRGIKRSPYEALFGKKLELGYGDQQPPVTEETDIESDEEEFKNIDGAAWADPNRQVESETEYYASNEDLEEEEPHDALETVQEEELLNFQLLSMQNERIGARGGQKRQADKMLEASNKR